MGGSMTLWVAVCRGIVDSTDGPISLAVFVAGTRPFLKVSPSARRQSFDRQSLFSVSVRTTSVGDALGGRIVSRSCSERATKPFRSTVAPCSAAISTSALVLIILAIATPAATAWAVYP